MRRTASTIPAALLLVLLAAVIYAAAGVINDVRAGFCAQLDPCHEEDTQQ